MKRYYLCWLLATLICLNLSAQKQNPNEKVTPVVKAKRSLFNLEDVRINDATFKTRQSTNYQYLLNRINPDKLLCWFRWHAGLDARDVAYGGWEGGGSVVMGHYLSAISQMYASTGDAKLLERVKYMIDELYACQTAPDYVHGGKTYQNKNGLYAYRFFREIFNEEIAVGNIYFTWNGDRGNPNIINEKKPSFHHFIYLNAGLPWYTTHKVFSGVRDAYYYTGYEKAKTVLVNLTDWVYEMTKNYSDEDFQRMLIPEYGGMNEVIVDVYALTGDQKYLTLSRKFNHRDVMTAAENGDLDGLKRDITDIHANTTLAKFLARGRQYELTGAQNDWKAIKNFYDYVIDYHTFVLGGNSEWEGFREPGVFKNKLTARNAEMCNTYNMLKLAEKVYELDGSEKVIDYYERALYNHVLAGIHPDKTGAYCYYMPLKPGHYKTYSLEYDSHWCCCGTGMENASRYAKAIYAHTAKDLYVNMYISSTLTWEDAKTAVKMESEMPKTGKTKLTVTKTDGQERSLFLRYPSWAHKGMTVMVNNKPQTTTAKPGGYIELKAAWKANDVVTVDFPLDLWFEPLPDDPTMVSIFYGPQLLAGQLGKKEMPSVRVSDNHAHCDAAIPVPVTIPFIEKSASPEQLLLQDAKNPLKFTFKKGVGFPEGVILEPFYDLHDQRYTVYWRLHDTQRYTAPQSDGEYKIRWGTLSQYLTYHANDRDAKVYMTQQSTSSSIRQEWKFVADAAEPMTFRIVDAKDEKKCISVASDVKDNVLLKVVAVSKTDNKQKWEVQPNAGGYYIVSNGLPYIALNRLADGTLEVLTRDKANAGNQRFTFEPIGGSTVMESVRNESQLELRGRELLVNNCSSDLLRIFDLKGNLLMSKMIDTDKCTFNLDLGKGVYIAQAGSETRKLLLN